MKKVEKERLVSFIEEFKKAHDGRGTASGLIVGMESSRKYMRQVCHAFLCREDIFAPVGVISGLQHRYGEDQTHGPGDWGDTTTEEKILYLDWLMKRSPYKEAFLYKSPRRALRDKCVVVRGECPAATLGAALVATRRLWEHTSVAVVFCELVKRGVPENLAYYLGHLAGFTRGRKGAFSWDCAKSSHCTIDSHDYDREAVKKFVLGRKVYVGKPYRVSPEYHGYGDRMFGRNDGAPLIRFIDRNFPYKSEEPLVASSNPFLAAVEKKNSHTCSFSHAMDKMAEFYPTILKEIGLE